MICSTIPCDEKQYDALWWDTMRYNFIVSLHRDSRMCGVLPTKQGKVWFNSLFGRPLLHSEQKVVCCYIHVQNNIYFTFWYLFCFVTLWCSFKNCPNLRMLWTKMSHAKRIVRFVCIKQNLWDKEEEIMNLSGPYFYTDCLSSKSRLSQPWR